LAKKAFVYDGTNWIDIAQSTADLSNYATKAEGVRRYASAAARATAIPSPTAGMITYLDDTGTESPTSTISQLETYTGSQWQAPYGLTLVATASASNAALTIDNCFTSDFENYRIELYGTGSATTQVYIQMRTTAPATETASWYFGNIRCNTSTATINAATGGNTSRMQITDVTNATTFSATFDVVTPRVARQTAIQGFANYAANADVYTLNGLVINTTLHAGFTIFQNSGNLTSVTARVYGYRNS
jgi:hypothetical protein